MEPAMYFVIILSSILFFFVIVLAIVFLRFRRSKPRPHQDFPRSRPSSVPSSSRSRMAARWAHMDEAVGALKTADHVKNRNQDYEGVAVAQTNAGHAGDGEQDFPDEFGAGGGIASSRSGRNSIPSSAAGSALVGAGPNGTRTFLKGWFGLDEPNYSGFNVTPEVREKAQSDTLPMRRPGGHPTSSIAADPVPHHRVPTAEEDGWETSSAHEELA